MVIWEGNLVEIGYCPRIFSHSRSVSALEVSKALALTQMQALPKTLSGGNGFSIPNDIIREAREQQLNAKVKIKIVEKEKDEREGASQLPKLGVIAKIYFYHQ